MPVFTKPLSDKQEQFVREYLVDFNGVRAAGSACYKDPNKSSQMLLNNPAVKREIEKRRAILEKKLDLTTDEILKHLYWAVTRNTRDFIDPETGRLFPLHKLNDRAASVVDGIEQDVYYDQEGNEHCKTKLKLMSKSSALDMATKVKGMLASQKLDVTVTANVKEWHDALNEPPDTVEKAIEEMKKLPHVDVEEQPDGSYGVKELIEESEDAE